MQPNSDAIWALTNTVIGAAIEVHRELGPGLLESAYDACLRHELALRGLAYEAQRSLPVVYKGLAIDVSYRIDLIVENVLLIELKSVSELSPIHDAQVLTYLRLSGIDVGLLMNFNSRALRHGIRRFVRAGATLGMSPERRGTYP